VLSRPADQITILDIWNALEGPLHLVRCLGEHAGCEMLDECATREVWEKLREAAEDVLGSFRLADLAKGYGAETATENDQEARH
jgi:Rrf2 family protein